MPLSRSVIPKIKRLVPLMGSIPTQETSNPSIPAISPLIWFLPLMLEMIVRPNRASAKNSGAAKLRAKLEIFFATRISTSALTTPPKTEAFSAMSSAVPAFPAWARGYPSSAVAAEAAVPGVLIRIAVMEPP